MLLLYEVKDKLAYMSDIETICDLLEIDTEELLDRFEDKLEDRLDRVLEEYELE